MTTTDCTICADTGTTFGKRCISAVPWPLTDERIDSAWLAINHGWGITPRELLHKFARAIERELLSTANAAQAGVREWISVKDQLPELREEVLVWCGYLTVGHRSDDRNDPENHEGWVIDFDNGNATAITHWMPLPSTPSPIVNSKEGK